MATIYYDKDADLKLLKGQSHRYYRLWEPGPCPCPEPER